MKLRCLIIDDDPMICDLVKHFCSKIPDIEFCISASTGRDGLQLLGSQKIDLLILDYHLPDMTGHAILEINSQQIPIVMITSEKDFAVTAYEYDEIYDFLIKPIGYERFVKAIDRIKNISVSGNSMVPFNDNIYYIKDGNKFVKIQFSDLLFLKAEENYVSFVSQEKSILNLSTLKEAETKLPPYFMKVHRSYIVNLEKIDSATTEEIKIGSYSIPISQKFKRDLMFYLANK